MRAVALALVLVSAPAWATNVFFSPFIDQSSHQRDVLYLSDVKSAACAAPARLAHVETDAGKPISTGPICWWFDDNGGFDLQFLATGASQQGATGFGVVPGAQQAYQALMREHVDDIQAQAAALQRSMNTPLKVHP